MYVKKEVHVQNWRQKNVNYDKHTNHEIYLRYNLFNDWNFYTKNS